MSSSPVNSEDYRDILYRAYSEIEFYLLQSIAYEDTVEAAGALDYRLI